MIEQMRKEILLLLAFVFLCIHVSCQETPTQLKMSTIYNISLTKDTKAYYEITIPSIKAGQNLYISGYSAINDPDQQPILKINSSSYSVVCQQQSSDLNEVCFIPSSQLRVGDKLTVQATCRINCDARLIAYLSEIVELDLNEKVQIEASGSPIEKQLKIYVPTNLEYTEILLLFDVVSPNPRQAVSMYIKSSPNVAYPKKDSHDNIKLFNWGFKTGAVLYKNTNIRPGDAIYVLLSIGKNSVVTFESRYVAFMSTSIQLNQQLYDYLLPPASFRIYSVNLSSLSPSSLQFPLIIEFQEFSGSPKIEVALNDKFTNGQLVQPELSVSKLRFKIAPKMMKSAQFAKKMVYIKVTTTSGSTFTIHPKLKMNDVNSIDQGVTEYVEIKQGENGVFVYRHDKMKSNVTQFFKMRIINEGAIDGEVSAYSCLQSNSYSCQVQKSGDIALPASYKKLKTSNIDGLVKIEYNIQNDCLMKSESSEQYSCTFMLIIYPSDRSKVGKYAVTIIEPNKLIFLRQGQSYSIKMNRQEYAYFYFYLPFQQQQFTNKIISLSFFANTLDGNVNMLSSPQIITPTLADLPNPFIKQGINNITYENAQIRTNLFYLTLFALEHSDVIINVIVRRVQQQQRRNFIRQNLDEVFKESMNITSIQLTDGNAQSFTLEKGVESVQYRFIVFGFGNVSLVVTDLIGKVKTFYTRESDHTRKQCLENYCTFPARPGQSFFVEVQGPISTIRKFNIVYRQVKQCYRYPIGSPIYVLLDQRDTECLQFTVRLEEHIQISSSLTKLQLLNKDTEIVIEFEQSNYTFVMTSNSYLLQKQDLVQYCGSNSQEFCKIKIKFISFDFPVQLQFVLQRTSGLITLYDGVVQKIETELGRNTGKYFRVPIDLEDGAEIFITSESTTEYVIYAKLLEASQSSNVSNYPDNNTKQGTWRVQTSSDLPTLTMLPIQKYRLGAIAKEKNISYPWLAISVFSNSLPSEQAIFEIEVTQSQRILRVGQQHIGFVQSNEFVLYEVYPSSISLLSVRSLNNFKCYRILDESRREISNEDIYIQEPRTIPLQYYLVGENGMSCMYQISVQDYQNSILQVTEGFSTRVVLEYQEVTYLLYHHTENKTFRIYEFLEAGSSAVYATPLNTSSSKSIREFLDSTKLNDYEYRGDQVNNLQVEAKENGTDYCYDCYYVIAIKGTPSVHEDVVVVRDPTPVTIREHMIVDSYLNPPDKQTFIYYAGAFSTFNLSIDVVYGHVTVTVKQYSTDPEGKVVKVQSVQNGMFVIPVKTDINILVIEEHTDTLNQQRKYKIQVVANSHSLYHLQILKSSDVFRIVQGMASRVIMPAEGSLNLGFSSLIDQGLVELNVESRLIYNAIIPSVYFRAPGESMNSERLINSTFRVAGKMLIVTFSANRGHYTIKLVSFQRSSYEINVLIPKSGITELREGNSVTATRETIFQVYIQEDSYAIIQAFQCTGHIKIRASNELKYVQRATPNKNELNLLHRNVGGHFAIATPENKTGQYFIRVQSKEYTASISQQVNGLSYLIKYRLQKKTEKNPYEYFDTESLSLKVTSGEHMENVTIKVGRIKSLDDSIEISDIRYIFSIGKSPEDLKNYMVCTPKEDAQHLTLIFARGKDDDDILQANISKLEILKKMGHENAYVGAYALINIKHKNGNAYDDFVFMFEPAYLGKLKSSKVITAIGLFEIIVLVFLIIGGAVIIYALAIYLLKVYRGYSNTNELVEESFEDKKEEISQNKLEASHS